MQNLLNLTIRGKIFWGFGIILLLFGAVTLSSVMSARKIQDETEFAKNIRCQHGNEVTNLVTLGTSVNSKIFSAADAELYDLFVKASVEAKAFKESLDILKASPKLDSNIMVKLLEVEVLFPELLEVGEKMVSYAVNQDFVELIPVRQQYTELSEKFDAVGKELRATATANVNQVLTDIATNANQMVSISVIIWVLALVGALFMVLTISRSITKPLNNAIRIIEKISLGDTTEEVGMSLGKSVNCSSIKNCGVNDCPSFGREDHCWVTSGSLAVVKHCPSAIKGEDCSDCNIYGAKTEIEELASIVTALSNNLTEKEEIALQLANGDLTADVPIASDKDALSIAMKNMSDSLREIIGQVKFAGDQIVSGSTQVSDSSQALSQGATEQASSLEEINSSMIEMAAQTKTNAENASQADMFSNEAKDAAAHGNVQMAEMIVAMEEINGAAQNISKIIKVIDEIAFQTNLLALNAAVEAARAGKHGKGFAVVAEEVRNLAARSAKAARETTELIEGSVAKSNSGSEIANTTAVVLGDIVRSVSKVNDLVEEIAASSNQQALGIAQVNEGLNQVDNVTQRNTANAEESAAASEELAGQAHGLQGLLDRFTLPEDEETGSRQIPMEQRYAAETFGYQDADRSEQDMLPHVSPDEVINLDDREFGKY